MNRRVLFVDDEQNVLDAIVRQLRRTFMVETATGAEEGLRKLAREDPYAVVVSDMRMPGMDGAEFLRQVETRSPESIRMMLTGNSDQQTAIDAVNKGRIFRFLNKPCDAEMLIVHVEAGIRQYELVMAERDLLEKTLKGSIAALVDILAIANPAAFCRAERIKHYVAHMTKGLALADPWKYEVAAMLSQIGFVTVPEEVLEKHIAGETLTEDEEEMILDHRQDACLMLEKIPRLEEVGKMISLMGAAGMEAGDSSQELCGAELISIASEFDKRISRGAPAGEAILDLRGGGNPLREKALDALRSAQLPSLEKTVSMVPISELRIGMILAEDIRHNGSHALIVSKGQVINAMMRRRLRNFLMQETIGDKVRIYEEHQVFSQ